MPVDYSELHSTDDASVWAKKLFETIAELGQLDEDLLLGWFANAIETAKDRQTFVQHSGCAENIIKYHQIVSSRGSRELLIAEEKLQEAQMWFTRALAIDQGKFNPTDLEKKS